MTPTNTSATLETLTTFAGAAVGGKCVRSICQPMPPKTRRTAEVRNKRKHQKESRRKNRK
jgi:hypothetical protein